MSGQRSHTENTSMLSLSPKFSLLRLFPSAAPVAVVNSCDSLLAGYLLIAIKSSLLQAVVHHK